MQNTIRHHSSQAHFSTPRNGNSSAKSDTPYEQGGELYRDFPGRDGYDPNFLGEALPLPTLGSSIKNQAAPLLSDPSQIELKYTHFSVIQNKERRYPMLTAVNVDGAEYRDLERDGKWALDGRIAREHQLGNEAYSNNAIDKGHMVRRRDPSWGVNAEKGAGDTFVYTNAGLQHSQLNQGDWLDLENFVLDTAIKNRQRYTVMQGPVMREDDPKFDNKGKMHIPTKMPMEFWKVRAWNEPGQGLVGEAYVLSQKDLLNLGQANGREEHLTPEQLAKFRVPLDQLEKITDLDFGNLKDAAAR